MNSSGRHLIITCDATKLNKENTPFNHELITGTLNDRYLCHPWGIFCITLDGSIKRHKSPMDGPQYYPSFVKCEARIFLLVLIRCQGILPSLPRDIAMHIIGFLL